MKNSTLRASVKAMRWAQTLSAILSCKGGPMKDSRIPRGGAVNDERNLISEWSEDQIDDREMDCWD